MSVSNEIRKYMVKNVFDEARAEGRRRCSVTSGEIHSAMRLKNRMPAVCSALRSKKLQQIGSVRLLREVRRPGVKLNSSTNWFEFEILGPCSDEGESEGPFNAKRVEEDRDVSNQNVDKHGTLVVVPCGKAKIWKRYSEAGPTRARDAYTGSPFKVNREYAERFADWWVILSAKHGLIEPDFAIPEDYNVTFGDKSSDPISMETLREQASRMEGFERVVTLGSTEYAEKVKSAFRGTGMEVLTPTAGLPIGKAMGKVKDAIRRGQPFGRSDPVEYSERGLRELEGKFRVWFRDKRLLVAAVTRRAYVKELRDKQPEVLREDNERLEFLGDGVLELAVRHCLYDRHTGQEGDLSEMADELVKESNLTMIAEDLAIESHLFMGKGEESDEKGKLSILAGALEAIIGAVYLDQGLNKTIEVVERLIIN